MGLFELSGATKRHREIHPDCAAVWKTIKRFLPKFKGACDVALASFENT